MTKIKGVVVDSQTEEPIMFANIAFVGTTIGTTSDIDGTFELETKFPSDSLLISYIGYQNQTVAIEKGVKQELNIVLISSSINLNVIEIKQKGRGKYKRKDNPAVALIKNVIKHKNDNRIGAQDYYEYEKYEKIEFDLNNFDPEKMRKRRAFKKFQFLFDYVDTSELNGKPYLPFYIQETSSKVYYRKSPKSKKEYREGINVLGIEDYLNIEDFSTMMDVLYEDIDIYSSNIRLLDMQFMSPLNPVASTFYRFFIRDTVEVNGYSCIKLACVPENKSDLVFRGDLYILNDSSYALIKADLELDQRINLNFVQDLKLIQEFSKKDGVWVLSKDKIIMDFAIFKKGTGIFGKREVSYKDFKFGEPRDEEIYSGSENVIAADDAYKRGEEFWQKMRHDTLTIQEKGTFKMIDTLTKVPAFKTITTLLQLAFTGYKAWGPVDVGPIGNFYSYNPVEGLRLKAGGETNLKFNPKFSFAGYAAYGFGDERWKYAGSFLYSFKDNFRENPKHYFRVSYQHDVQLVGQQLKFSSADNFFLSLQRGTRDRMLFLDRYKGEYFLELLNNLSFDFSYTNTNQQPYGATVFKVTDPISQEIAFLPEIRTSEVGLKIRFAPNEQFIQGRSHRVPIFNKYPIFTLTLNQGLKDMLGGDYSYGSATLNIFKRFYLSLLGSMRFEVEAGKYWGEGVPYFLLHLPRANQSFAYRSGDFNMMNYQEFVNDAFVWAGAEHYLNGFFFNRIPLFRRLKLREVISFKGIYGRLSDQNDPRENPELIQFIEDDGREITSTLEDKPYLEASVGIMNIFKFGRIDMVRRLTYLDRPDVPDFLGVKGMSIRIKMSASF
ncbi:MAG: DUF5686 family protein [Bacteroidota bacterium]